jgi:hypothetical protein
VLLSTSTLIGLQSLCCRLFLFIRPESNQPRRDIQQFDTKFNIKTFCLVHRFILTETRDCTTHRFHELRLYLTSSFRDNRLMLQVLDKELLFGREVRGLLPGSIWLQKKLAKFSIDQ